MFMDYMQMLPPFYMKDLSIIDFAIPEVPEPDRHGSWKTPVHSKHSLIPKETEHPTVT